MLFGSKKPKEEKAIPIEEVQKMTKKGMSDKDIIKHLKGKGYSYESIEGAMLKAVKEGVDDDHPKVVERLDTESPASQNFFDTPQDDFGQDFIAAPEMDTQMETEGPEVMLEEVVEGIVEEKWHKFSDDLRKFDENIERMKAEIKQFDMKLEQVRKDSPVKDLDARMSGISDQLEDMEARVGGLEKAFKQFLPSLTRNIESLSQMIHEMKERQSVHEELE